MKLFRESKNVWHVATPHGVVVRGIYDTESHSARITVGGDDFVTMQFPHFDGHSRPQNIMCDSMFHVAAICCKNWAKKQRARAQWAARQQAESEADGGEELVDRPDWLNEAETEAAEERYDERQNEFWRLLDAASRR